MTYLTLCNALGLSNTPLNHNTTTNEFLTPNTAQPYVVDYFNNSTNVSSLLQFSIPDGKLFYPEPFIASPSYLHSDITYLHIFQY